MSFPFINLVFKSPVPRGPDRLCLVALADYADDSGMCWPSQPTLARKCAVGERAIRYTLARLENGGHVRVERRSGRSSVYWIVAEALSPATHCHGQEDATQEAHCRNTQEAHCRNTQEAHCRSPRKPTADKPPMNHQIEPPTEPSRSVGSENEVGLKSNISSIVARLRNAGEKDARLNDKVASLVAQYGPDLVSRQCDALARQYTGKGFGFGLLVKAVKQPDSFNFVAPGPVAGPTTPSLPVPGTSRTAQEAAALDAAGVTAPEDWENRGEDFLLWFAPCKAPSSGAPSRPTISRNGIGGESLNYQWDR